MKTINTVEMLEATRWWNSLPNGKKRYYKEHTRLTTSEHILRYWLAHIKPSMQTAFMEDRNHG